MDDLFVSLSSAPDTPTHHRVDDVKDSSIHISWSRPEAPITGKELVIWQGSDKIHFDMAVSNSTLLLARLPRGLHTVGGRQQHWAHPARLRDLSEPGWP